MAMYFNYMSKGKNSQFYDIVGALKIYASAAYKSEIKSLTELFAELKDSTVVDPEESKIMTAKEKTLKHDGEGIKFRKKVYK